MEIYEKKLILNKPFGIPIHIFTRIYFVLGHFAPLLYFLYKPGNICKGAIIFQVIYAYLGGFGITIGCHRYWTHKTFKAKFPLQILLMIFQTIAGQLTIYNWCVDHRIHHMFTDTNVDPHNSKRGFWFSHIGWQLVPRSKEFLEKEKTLNMSDLANDPVVRFQNRWFWTLFFIFHFAIPVPILCYVWEMPLLDSVLLGLVRHIISLHVTFCVNSVAHMLGYKPYDRFISATENKFVSLLTVGEGWHNYHHTFPWDYRASEFGWKLNLSTMLIDFFARIGWVWELKTVSRGLLDRRVNRTGKIVKEEHKRDERDVGVSKLGNKSGSDFVCGGCWGWDDENIPTHVRLATKILKPELKN